MVGWWITVFQLTPEEIDAATAPGSRRPFILATWESGLGGIEWLEQLVRAGQARQLLDEGYPCRFVAAARDVLPLLASGAPPFHGGAQRMSGDWLRDVELHSERIAACPPDQVLTIDAWDRS